jgi:hypothetical protein
LVGVGGGGGGGPPHNRIDNFVSHNSQLSAQVSIPSAFIREYTDLASYQ